MKWLVFLFAVVACFEVPAVTDKNFKSVVVESGKWTLVDFYADWCRHCKKLAPIYEEVAQLYENEPSVQIVKINGDKEGRRMSTKYNVPGYPFIYMFHGDDEPIEYEGNRDAELISNFVSQLSGVAIEREAEASLPPRLFSEVEHFGQEVLQHDTPTLVYFTKSQCYKCGQFDVVLEELAQVFASDEGIKFAKVDVSTDEGKEIGHNFGMHGLPTISLFNPHRTYDGVRRPVLYEGPAGIQTLVDFVNEEAGLHRHLDGTLKLSAGRIARFDELVQKLGQASAADISKEINDILNVVSDKTNRYHGDILRHGEDDSMVSYYQRLVNKALNGESRFFAAEAARLGNLLRTSSQKPATRDHMQKRLNILRVFPSTSL